MSDGSTPPVSANWSLSTGAPGNISSSGQLTANGVGANTAITVTASYSYGGITKTANYNVTIDAPASCGSYATNVVSNGDLESGSTGWTLSGGAIISTTGSLYHSATHYLWLGGDNGTDSAYYQTTIPSSATSATLSLYENINSSESTSLGAYDTFSIVVRDTSGNLLGTVANWSNLNGTSPGNYSYQTFNMSAYSGKTIRIYFVSNCHLSGGQTTNFRVDDVGLILALPNPATPVLFGVGGQTTVAQGSTAQYNAIVVNCDNSIISVSPTWSISSGPASISASGLLTAGTVSADTSATVTANYPGFAALNYNITIAHVAPVFTSLAINGPNSLNENSSGQFTASALFSDGSSQVVTPNWSIASGPGEISTAGLLTVDSLGTNTTTTLSATYSAGGITHNASQQVSIVYVPPAPTFISLTINGPPSIVENRSGQYSATEWFSDGSSQIVIPTWSVNSTNASISTFGLLTADEVSSNTPVLVSASYMDGITLSVSNQVMVLNVPIFANSVLNQGKFQSTLSGLSVGQTVIVYSSSNLTVWVPIQTNSVLSGSTFTFTNTFGPDIGNQYFRAQVQ